MSAIDTLRVIPNSLFDSFSLLHDTLPIGTGNYHHDSNTLTRIQEQDQPYKQLPLNSVRIVNTTDTIKVSKAFHEKPLQDDVTNLELKFDGDRIREGSFSSKNQRLELRLSDLATTATLAIPIIQHLLAVYIPYSGDKKKLRFDRSKNLKPESLAILFDGGKVADIPVQQIIFELLLQEQHPILSKIYPRFAYDRTDFHSIPNRETYTFTKHRGKVQDQRGAQFKGVSIVRGDGNAEPHSISVDVLNMEEIPFGYQNGTHPATNVTGEIYVHGQKVDIKKVKEFMVHSTQDEVQVTSLLGQAFAAVMYN